MELTWINEYLLLAVGYIQPIANNKCPYINRAYYANKSFGA